MSNALPIIDLRALDGDADDRKRFYQDLAHAAREVGFFYVVGHGVSLDILTRLGKTARQFFELPEKDKLQIHMINSPHFRGYTRVGDEITRGKPDWREQIDIGLERDPIAQGPGVPVWTRLQGPNQWPAALPELRTLTLAYVDAQEKLTLRLLSAFARILEQPEGAFDYLTRNDPAQGLKIIRYPGRDQREDRQGVGSHKDGGLLTTVFQDKQKGLEVELDSGWVSAEPLENSFVVNIGELLELASDGYLKATVHRVVSPPLGTDRISLAYFLGAAQDAQVKTLALPERLAHQARGVTADPDNPLYHDVGNNSLKSWLRSHREVAQKYHADLVDA